MTNEQIQWAMKHDWYIFTGRCSVTGEAVVTVKDDMIKGHKIQFRNFEELQQWAGY
jgi:hypothetical protein